MNYTKETLTCILCFLCVALTQLIRADAVDPNLLRKNRIGEDRPSWWYDLWYGNNITVLAAIKQKIPEKPEIKVTVERGDVNATQVGFSALEIEIDKVLDISKGENYLNSNTFKKGSKVIIYVFYKFNDRTSRWAPLNVFKNEENQVMHLSKAGPILPGEYFINWVLPAGDQKIVEEIILARYEAVKKR